MKLLASDPAFHKQLVRTLGYVTYGGAEIGECLAVCENIPAGDYKAWYEQWWMLAQRAYQRAERVKKYSPIAKYNQDYLAASNYARTAFLFLEEKQSAKINQLISFAQDSFHKALESSRIKFEYIKIPYENTYLPGIIYYAFQFVNEPRDLIIDTGGGDSILEELFFNALPAISQGFHYVTFEGPGQGSVLRQRNLPLRPDWENVVGAVVDYCESRDFFKYSHKALYGASFGGYLAPRAATKEKRIDALICDPGILDPSAFLMSQFPLDLQDNLRAQNFAKTEDYFDKLKKLDPQQHFLLNSRCHRYGAGSISEMLYLASQYHLKDSIKQITCPTLVLDNESEHLSKGQAKKLFEELTCLKNYIYFTEAEGAGGHCQPLARRNTSGVILNWLHEAFV